MPKITGVKHFKLDAEFLEAIANKSPSRHGPIGIAWTEEMDFYIKECYGKLGKLLFTKMFAKKFGFGSAATLFLRHKKLMEIKV